MHHRTGRSCLRQNTRARSPDTSSRMGITASGIIWIRFKCRSSLPGGCCATAMNDVGGGSAVARSRGCATAHIALQCAHDHPAPPSIICGRHKAFCSASCPVILSLPIWTAPVSPISLCHSHRMLKLEVISVGRGVGDERDTERVWIQHTVCTTVMLQGGFRAEPDTIKGSTAGKGI